MSQRLVVLIAIIGVCLSFHIQVSPNTKFNLNRLIGKTYFLNNVKTQIVFNMYHKLDNLPKPCYNLPVKSNQIFAYVIKHLPKRQIYCSTMKQHFDKKVLKERTRLAKILQPKEVALNDYEFKTNKNGFLLKTNINETKRFELHFKCRRDLKARKAKFLTKNKSKVSIQLIGYEGCAVKKSKVTNYLNKLANMIDFIENPTSSNPNIPKQIIEKTDKIWNIVQFCILALIGVLLMTMGIKLYNCSLAGFGFVVGAALAYIIMQHYSTKLEIEPWLRIVLCLVSALILGPIFYKLFVWLTDLVAMLVGGLCGLVLSLAIIEAISKNGGQDIHWAIRLGIFQVCIVVVGGVSWYYDDRMIIFNTAIFGVYVCLAGLFNYLKKVNKLDTFKKNMNDFNFSKLEMWQTCYVGGILLFFFVGLICQCHYNEKQENNPYRKLEEKKS